MKTSSIFAKVNLVIMLSSLMAPPDTDIGTKSGLESITGLEEALRFTTISLPEDGNELSKVKLSLQPWIAHIDWLKENMTATIDQEHAHNFGRWCDSFKAALEYITEHGFENIVNLLTADDISEVRRISLERAREMMPRMGIIRYIWDEIQERLSRDDVSAGHELTFPRAFYTILTEAHSSVDLSKSRSFPDGIFSESDIDRISGLFGTFPIQESIRTLFPETEQDAGAAMDRFLISLTPLEFGVTEFRSIITLTTRTSEVRSQPQLYEAMRSFNRILPYMPSTQAPERLKRGAAKLLLDKIGESVFINFIGDKFREDYMSQVNNLLKRENIPTLKALMSAGFKQGVAKLIYEYMPVRFPRGTQLKTVPAHWFEWIAKDYRDSLEEEIERLGLSAVTLPDVRVPMMSQGHHRADVKAREIVSAILPPAELFDDDEAIADYLRTDRPRLVRMAASSYDLEDICNWIDGLKSKLNQRHKVYEAISQGVSKEELLGIFDEAAAQAEVIITNLSIPSGVKPKSKQLGIYKMLRSYPYIASYLAPSHNMGNILDELGYEVPKLVKLFDDALAAPISSRSRAIMDCHTQALTADKKAYAVKQLVQDLAHRIFLSRMNDKILYGNSSSSSATKLTSPTLEKWYKDAALYVLSEFESKLEATNFDEFRYGETL